MVTKLFAAVLAAGLMGAPLPHAVPRAAAQSAIPEGPAKPGKTKKAKSTRPPTPGQQAARTRQKKCGEEWRAAKAAGKIEKGMKWPRYWSACNTRLKAGG